MILCFSAVELIVGSMCIVKSQDIPGLWDVGTWRTPVDIAPIYLKCASFCETSAWCAVRSGCGVTATPLVNVE